MLSYLLSLTPYPLPLFPMRNIKLTIEYDGTNFNGWQIQGQGHRTVQGDIETALQKIFKKKIRLIGSGRTDSGVHALGQVANFTIASKMPTGEIIKALNGNLAEDVVVLDAKEVPVPFHAQYNAKRKTYRYTILNRKATCAQQRNFCLYFPYKLNLTAMRQEAKSLVGKKDFRSFMASDAKKRLKIAEKDTVRTIYRLDIKKKKDLLLIEIEANGFLYKMVRNIVGTLLDIGTGKLPPGSLKEILSQRNRQFAADTAPAKGLCLIDVKY